MNAKEMFEKLGYNFTKGWLYDRYAEALNYHKEIPEEDYNEEYILFDVEEHAFWKEDEYGNALSITMQEIQAINEQCKELGWIE